MRILTLLPWSLEVIRGEKQAEMGILQQTTMIIPNHSSGLFRFNSSLLLTLSQHRLQVLL
jgi:hypothetical protein